MECIFSKETGDRGTLSSFLIIDTSSTGIERCAIWFKRDSKDNKLYLGTQLILGYL